ncbi:MAG: ferrous iron transport protein B [Flavobacteriales bacterium]|nr:ferrous iron transport protein B [Flavobacteriales bacterium]
MKLALIGNPNVGKTSLFNQLTDSVQRTGNYPGITVEKVVGKLKDSKDVEIIDFPGIYSLYPESIDEKLVYDVLKDKDHIDFPDCVILVIDYTSLKRGFFLYQQIRDLDIPVLLVLNKVDKIQDFVQFQDSFKRILQEDFSQEVFFLSTKRKIGIDTLIQYIKEQKIITTSSHFQIPQSYSYLEKELNNNDDNIYKCWLELAQVNYPTDSEELKRIKREHKIIPKRLQVAETLQRYNTSEELLDKIQSENESNSKKSITHKLDKVLMHPIFGYLIFFGLMFIIFQLLFSLAEYPMIIIENTFNFLSLVAKQSLPSGPLFSLISDGIIPGIGGVVVFVPQIALLFFFIMLMEQSGYMSRVVFLMDRFMKPFGLNGKSIIPFISGAACAIPAIMSARNIESKKERLLTILVTPFITCSARLPVYSVLIALVIPKMQFLGLNLRGIVLMGMYLLGIVTALVSSWVLKKVVREKYKGFLVVEIPDYQVPDLRVVLKEVISKSNEFLLGAGKIIVAVSVLLWGLASFSFDSSFANWEPPKIEESFLGKIGKSIEPAIRPLGYDWKIGIGIVSSVAAREVFVGTMKVIYNLEGNQEQDSFTFTGIQDFMKKMYNYIFDFSEEDSDQSLVKRMKKESFSDTGEKVFTLASGLSIMFFYAFAMQCISTIAVVKQETNSWKWTIIQFVGMTLIAYISALLVYNLF